MRNSLSPHAEELSIPHAEKLSIPHGEEHGNAVRLEP
jgi:hypothetical protein